jgi:myotubularin-related protein 5/13
MSYIFDFQEVHRIQTDLGHLQQKWRIIWDKLEGPSHDSMRRNTSFSTQMVKSHGRSIHKRSTLEILVKGKMLGEAAKRFSQPHRFDKFTYTTPAYCDYCSQVLWGFLKTGLFKK